MKKLESKEMSTLVGGDWRDIVDGGCAAVTAASIGAVLLRRVISLHPYGIAAMLVADLGCFAWGICNHT